MTASARKGFGHQLIATATPIAAEAAAKTIAIGSPSPATAVATCCCSRASHAVPSGAALIALDVASALLLGPRSHPHAMTSHSTTQAVLAPRGQRVSRGRSVGHTRRPMTAYRSTAPGAPVSGFAVLLNRNPNASANHQTISAQTKDNASAPLTVGR